jgi:hypothetical protein
MRRNDAASAAERQPGTRGVPGILEKQADRIVPMAGRESRGYPAYEVSVELGRKLGRALVELPGGHVGLAARPAEFAHQLVQALARTGRGPKW